ncbi:MAG: hypothetical protein ABI056_03415 [Caulobacteraceae bacterium]
MAVAKGEVGGVQISGPVRVLEPEVHAFDRPDVRSHLAGETLDHPRAFHVPAIEAEGEDDALPQHCIGGAQQVERLDEAGHADHGITAGRAANALEHT